MLAKAQCNLRVWDKDYSWISPSDKKIFTLEPLKNDGKGKMEICGKFHFLKDNDKAFGTFRQSVELLTDGRIQIDASFSVPPEFAAQVDEDSYNFV